MDPSGTQAYQGLAPIYDYVMRHVDYCGWADYIHRLLAPRHPAELRLADLACGTGNTVAHFEELGYPVVGADASEAMVEVARQKAAARGSDTLFYHCDLRQLDDLGPCDGAVCLYDSLNYLLTPQDLSLAIANVHTLLAPGNSFIFDVCTEQNSLRYFRDARDEDRGPGFSYRRHSRYDAEKRLQYNHFRLRFDGWEQELEETHTQRIYPLDQIIALVEASPFELVDYFDDFTFERATERSDRVHFVLRC